MTNTTGVDYIGIAAIILPVVTLIGIIVSMWLSVKALREVQIDRRIRHMPHLAFELGGEMLAIQFEKTGTNVSGIDRGYAKKVFKDIPENSESISLKTKKLENGREQVISEYGKLRNYGTGPALSTEVTWIAKKVKVGVEDFKITEDKLKEPRYSGQLTCIPASPNSIMPGEIASFFRLPTFIQKDFEKKIKEVEGVIEIKCTDILGGNQSTIQEFRIFTDYESSEPSIVITFGHVIKVNFSDSTIGYQIA